MALETDTYWVPAGHVIGVDVKIGTDIKTAYAQVKRKTFTQWPDFSLGSISASDSSDWTEIKSGDTEILRPEQKELLYHIFYGSHPVNMRVFEQMDSIVLRRIAGLVDKDSNRGWIGGILNEPNNPTPKTEFATIYGLAPRSFAAYNPQSASITGRINFFVMQYWVKWLTNARLISQFESLERKYAPLPLGDAQYVPTAPEWLATLLGKVK